jgi:hypothetical protein
MIYKFKFEVCNDDNVLLCARTEESGDFLAAFIEYITYVMKHFVQHRGTI